MKLCGIDDIYESALGEGYVFKQEPLIEDGVQTGVLNTYMNTRVAIGAILMFNGKSQEFPDAPEISMEDSQTMFGLTQELVNSRREGRDWVELSSSDVVFLRKMGWFCLHKSVFGHLNHALAQAENSPEGSQGIAMS